MDLKRKGARSKKVFEREKTTLSSQETGREAWCMYWGTGGAKRHSFSVRQAGRTTNWTKVFSLRVEKRTEMVLFSAFN